MASLQGWPPRHLSLPVTARTRSRGPQAARFIESYARITKDSIAGRVGERMVMREWQHRLLRGLLAEETSGRLRHRAALIGLPRKNGKSSLASGLALWGLFLGPDGGEVYSCAATRDQARIVFGSARRMVQLDPELASSCRLYRDAIEVAATGSVYRVLSREAGLSEGLSPTLVLFDEVHVQPDAESWDVMALAGGAREEPILIGITTAGARLDRYGQDSHCYKLYQHGRRVASGEVTDRSFFFAWWEPAAGASADHRDPKVWVESNPGYGDIVAAEDFTATVNRTSEAEFRTKRTNVWVAGTVSALPHGKWDALGATRDHDPDTPVVLMADGSWSGDSTGILAVTVEPQPHMWVVGLWERPVDAEHWRVPVEDVEQVLRDTCRTLKVLEVGMDPYRWQRSMSVLENEGLPMVEYPMGSAERMVKAWKTFYDGVLDAGFTHGHDPHADAPAARRSGSDPRLARHIEAMVLKIDAKGARPVKDAKMSARHIDLGVCAVAGIDRAFWHVEHTVDVASQVF